MSAPAVFSLTRAVGAEGPVVVEIPHAGLAVPEEVRGELDVSTSDVLRDADLFVDRLWAGAPTRGASLLVGLVSRYVVDLNRAEDDVDRDTVADHPSPRPVQSRGVVWRTTTDGRPVATRPISYAMLEARLARFHRPYHAALALEVERKRARFGHAIVVCAHSMPSASRPGGARRADIVPGSRGRTTASPVVIDLIDAHFRAAGLSVRHDDPYRGGYTTQRYGRPSEGLHAIQVEINRALYVDEATSRPLDGNLSRIAAILDDLTLKLASLEAL